MSKALDTKRRLILFLALTLAFSSITWWLIASSGSLQASGGLFTLGLMWSPGIAALLITFASQRNFKGLGWRWPSLRFTLLGYASPIAYALPAYGAIWLLGLGALTTDAIPAGRPIWAHLAVTATLGVVISMVSALGEEIGWRGLLVPQLARLIPPRGAALFSGILWAAWHYPAILFADYNSTAPRPFALACFTVMVVSASFLFAWLRLASGSLWPAAILHASHNLFVQGIFDPLTRDTGPTAYFSGEFGFALVVTTAVAGWLSWRALSRPARGEDASEMRLLA